MGFKSARVHSSKIISNLVENPSLEQTNAICLDTAQLKLFQQQKGWLMKHLNPRQNSMLNPCNLGHFITRASLQYVVCILLPWDPQHPAPIVQTLPTWRITPVSKCQSEHLKFTWKLQTTFRTIHVRPCWEDFCSEIHLLGTLSEFKIKSRFTG